MHFEISGNKPDTIFIWAHGWGRSHADFMPAANSLMGMGTHYVIDLPGFGQSPKPDAVWGITDYADHLAQWLETLPAGKRVWVGHSFGASVGIALAGLHPGLIDGLFVMGAAGIPRRRAWHQRLYLQLKVRFYKLLKVLVSLLGISKEKLAAHFGSADYRQAGAMRDIFIKVVRSNLTKTAQKIQCPTQLVYGEQDDDTPPEIGQRYAQLIPNGQLVVLPSYDHYTILTEGRQQFLAKLKQFVQETVHGH